MESKEINLLDFKQNEKLFFENKKFFLEYDYDLKSEDDRFIYFFSFKYNNINIFSNYCIYKKFQNILFCYTIFEKYISFNIKINFDPQNNTSFVYSQYCFKLLYNHETDIRKCVLCNSYFTLCRHIKPIYKILNTNISNKYVCANHIIPAKHKNNNLLNNISKLFFISFFKKEESNILSILPLEMLKEIYQQYYDDFDSIYFENIITNIYYGKKIYSVLFDLNISGLKIKKILDKYKYPIYFCCDNYFCENIISWNLNFDKILQMKNVNDDQSERKLILNNLYVTINSILKDKNSPKNSCCEKYGYKILEKIKQFKS